MRSKILFTDFRDIECGHLAWLTSDGVRHGVGNPPPRQVDMHAEPRSVPHGIRFAAQPATTAGPVHDYAGWGRVIVDGGCYRSWYLEINGSSKLGTGCAAYSEPPESVAVCNVESEDGLQWRIAGRCEIDVPGQRNMDGLTFFVDPAAPPPERHKFVYSAFFAEGMFQERLAEFLRQPAYLRDHRLTDQYRYGMFAAVSPDGLNWTPLAEPIMFHISDTDTSVLWDEALGKYVMYTRMFREGRRWIGRAETEDFRRWSPVRPVIWPRLDDPPDYDFYLNGYTRYPALPEYQLMFPMVWHRYTERSEVRLYSSADGIAWNQVPGGPVITPGEPEAWDAEFIGSGKDLLPFGDGRIAAPYSATRFPHKYPRWQAVWDAWKMGWAVWPRDRICALTADREGEFWTIPIVPAGRTIRLNMRTPMAGEIRVGIQGVEGRSASDCDPLVGDHTEKEVTWHGQTDIGTEPGQPLVVHFRLRCADLFSVEFR